MSEPVNVEELKRGGLVKLKEKDMFSVWVKTSCCNLNFRQLRKLAEITDKYARGYLLFTTRQIPIIPFVHIRDVEPVKVELGEVPLQLDRCGPRVRNINVCYEDKICPEAVTNSISLAEKLESFFQDPILHKIKIGVSGCSKDCTLTRFLTDIGFIGIATEGQKYDAYLGGRLGLDPFVGIRMAESLSEREAISFVRNYFELLRRAGKPGERSADLIKRLGVEAVKAEINRDLHREQPFPPGQCQNKLSQNESDRSILRLRATCGEVTSKQLVKIADIAERYGEGIIHFVVRGSPEIPGIDKSQLDNIRVELAEVGLEVLDGKGIGNLQSCFGSYCTESLVDPQSLLRRIEKRVAGLGVNDQDINISAAGCPNSCGIAQLNDIGFHGALEPEVDTSACTGCAICAAICRRKAIEIRNDLAVIDQEKCAHCGCCVSACPSGGMREKRRGFAVLVGFDQKNARLAHKVAEFVSEDEAFKIAEDFLKARKASSIPVTCRASKKYRGTYD